MNNIKIEKILYSKLMSFLILFSLLISYCYVSDNIYIKSFVLSISVIFSCFIYIFYLVNGKISTFSITFILYVLFVFFSTLLNDEASVIHFCYAYYRLIAILFYLDYGIKRYKYNIINSLYIVFYILIFCNFLSIIIFPNGLYSTVHLNNWFFNYDNAHIFMYFPAIILLFIRRYNFFAKSIFDYLLLMIITFCVFYCFSATSVVGYSIFLLYLLFERVFNKECIINSKNSFILYLATFLMFVVLRIQKIFSFFIENILGKTLTFSNRTILWDKVLLFIKDNFVFGYGKEYRYLVAEKFGRITFTNAHNTILDVLYKGGIVSLILFMYLIIMSVREMYKYKHERVVKLFSVVLISMFLMMNFEARNENIGFYITIILGYNIKNVL